MNVGLQAHDTMRKAYDFALAHIGQDRDSGIIWAEYIQFLNATKSSNVWETQQKMDALRKIYHRAVQIPLDNVDQLWTQLEVFEMGLNKVTAKKFMNELSPAHMQARTVLRQLNVHLQGLDNSAGSGIVLPAPATFSTKERQLIGRWKAYLKWEEGNPLEFEEKDRAILISRVEKAYRKAVIRMRYYPEIWFMAYFWTASVGKNNDALSLLKAGFEASPESFVLTYAYVEQLEKSELKKDQQNFSTVHDVYERFLGVLHSNLMRLAALVAPPISAEPNKNDIKEENNSLLTVPGLGAQSPAHQIELAEHKKQYSNAWINYMRFARRTQGQTVYRAIFSKARKDDFVGWEVYEAAAMTEYRCNLEDGKLVASRIFEVGMKKFGTDVAFVLAHISFLLTVNDKNNAHALFERVIGTFTPQEARPIWECWSRSQYQYDDLEAVLDLERRMMEIYPNDPPIKRFAQRYMYHSIDAIADHDLGFAKTRFTPSVLPSNGNNPLVSANANTNTNTDDNTNVNNKRPPPILTDRNPNEYKRLRSDEHNRDRRRYSLPRQPRRETPPREKEKKPVGLPAVLNWFVTQLPPRETFDGPIFNIDNLMDTLRTTVIPNNRGRSSPLPPRNVGMLLPDYSPCQGLQSGSLIEGGGRR
ncbi:Suf-domain-containing protein [Mycena albidolilacea]|uniref:mRNA 3'-end-processing protein RNA14 n=1 Tax=Mycena albidolilacea TaxID=1033008 RepID=A0AAD6YXY2_9AGAR|nr:Suf-domain-containing protein [Mycena albidolilacea]